MKLGSELWKQCISQLVEKECFFGKNRVWSVSRKMRAANR